ncbi:MAG: adenylyl cyclase, partial [Gammaproteobacteria bacterium]|nr:adenylyl cyclase [Gammaproteobacteria bacterium]
MSFFKELKERNVVKVAAIYVVTGWLLVQVATAVFPIFGIPDWAGRLVVLLIALGFPIALIMAWALELTPEGIKRAESSAGEKRMWAIAIALAVATIAWFELGGSASSTASGVHANVDDKSIAVLPFADLSVEGDQVYFGDGMAEEILNLLAKNPELRVAGRTSSFKFRGEETDLRNIGDALNVAHVLEGSVRKAGLQVRVTAQLIDTESGFHLWSETYDTQLDNIFEVQDRISASIVEALEATIAGDTKVTREAP